MRCKTGLVVGATVGYYFGAKAGRERYHQLQDVVDRVKDSPIVRKATQPAKEAAVDARNRARGLIDSRIASATPTPPTTDDDVTDRHNIFRDPTLN